MHRAKWVLLGVVATNSACGAMVTFHESRAGFSAATIASTSLNFSGLVADTDYFTQNTPLTVGGVEFSVETGSYIGIAGGQVADFRVLGAPFRSACLFSNNSSPVTARLPGGSFTAVGGVFGDMDSAGRAATLTLIGTTGVLDTREIAAGDMGLGAPETFFGWTVTGDTIVSVIYSLEDGHPHYEGMDDFTFGQAVPAPGGVWLMALAGGVWVRRRRA